MLTLRKKNTDPRMGLYIILFFYHPDYTVGQGISPRRDALHLSRL